MEEFVMIYKTGAISGILSGLVYAVLATALMTDFFATFSGTPGEVISSFLVIQYAVLTGIIGGIILGLVYTWVYPKLPVKSWFKKAVIFSLILWIVIFVFYLVLNPWILDPSELLLNTFTHYFIWGMVLGGLWEFLKTRM